MIGCTDMTTLVLGRSSGRCFGRVSRPLPIRWAHSCQAPTQMPARHPQIGQSKQRVQLRRVLGQTAIAHLHMAELALDDTERVLDLGANAGFDALDLFSQRILGIGVTDRRNGAKDVRRNGASFWLLNRAPEGVEERGYFAALAGVDLTLPAVVLGARYDAPSRTMQ